MEYRFFCENCHHSFVANTLDAKCPYCHSDNIRPEKKPNSALKIVGCTAVFAACFALGYFLMPAGSPQPVQDTSSSIRIEPEVPAVVVSYGPENLQLVKNPEYDAKSKKYAFEVKADCKDGAKSVKYYLLDADTRDITNPLAESSDGKFQVEPVEGGMYQVIALNIKNDKQSDAILVEDCIPRTVKIASLTKADLQSLFNMKDYAQALRSKSNFDKYYFVARPRVVLQGQEQGEAPLDAGNVIYSIFSRLEMTQWDRVNVLDVRYDDETGRICELKIEVIY